MLTIFADVNVSGMFVYIGLFAAAIIAVIVVASVFLSKRVNKRREEEDFPTGEDR